MATLHAAPTHAVPPALLRSFRTLLDDSFRGSFSDHDWEHAVGGTHVWLTQDGRLISHASLVRRTLWCDGVEIEVGYVEAMATAAGMRGAGHGSAVMRRIAELLCERYPLGALSSDAHPFYRKLGWELWAGPTFVMSEQGPVATPDDDGDIMILRTPLTPPLDPAGPIVCDMRRGDVW